VNHEALRVAGGRKVSAKSSDEPELYEKDGTAVNLSPEAWCVKMGDRTERSRKEKEESGMDARTD